VTTPRDCCSSEATARELPRRTFLGMGVAGLAATALFGGRIMAGPFSRTDALQGVVPEDKRFTASWLAQLTARGEPTALRDRQAQETLGMPIGGLFCGTLYLGGDGRLWVWDLFHRFHEGVVAHDGVSYQGRALRERDGSNYVEAPRQQDHRPVEQGFAVRVGDETRRLDKDGFDEVTWRGAYPIGRVSYAAADFPVEVEMEACSPFIPLHLEDSSMPCTVFTLTLRNKSAEATVVETIGWLENAVNLHSRKGGAPGVLRMIPEETAAGSTIAYTVVDQELPAPTRADIVFDRFEAPTYEGWTVEGEAFGDRPMPRADMAPYQDLQGEEGKQLVNSHNTRKSGPDSVAADRLVGRMSSRSFIISRDFVQMRVSGGNHPGTCAVELLVAGEVRRSLTGRDSNRMERQHWEVRDLLGKEAQLRIVDQAQGGWGHIGVDEILFTDRPTVVQRLAEAVDSGSMALSLRGGGGRILAQQEVAAFLAEEAVPTATAPAGPSDMPLDRRQLGALSLRLQLAPGEEQELCFVLAWYFPELQQQPGPLAALAAEGSLQLHYAARFDSAAAVSAEVLSRHEQLLPPTRQWHQDYYQQSTLPYWLLERSLLTLDCAATTACYRFRDGRFWAWEGIGCCPGTCQHVWNYAQGLARLFPEIERDTRERVDFGLAWHDSGAIDYRGIYGRHVAHDGQLGTILRAYREHTTAADGAFLARIWPRLKQSLQFLMRQDQDGDGLLEGEQYNTLDASWWGPMAWISSLYLAAVAAGEQMAREQGDQDFAARCQEVLETGRQSLHEKLFQGEYFIHLPDPEHPQSTNTNRGCHIDQLLGESWARQLGLPRVTHPEAAATALASLFRYNFSPDVGAYRAQTPIRGEGDVIGPGRWYAMPGEAGLLMCTWPHGGSETVGDHWAVGYFNECMSGFEYQVAAHMLYEGTPELVQAGLSIAKAIHDRYEPKRRNPYNEIECSDHYARAMASFGVFLGACGYRYHGPRGELDFAPRFSAEDFRSAFLAAEGWGRFAQQRQENKLDATLELSYGRLRLRQVGLEIPQVNAAWRCEARLQGRKLPLTVEVQGSRALALFPHDVELLAGQRLELHYSSS